MARALQASTAFTCGLVIFLGLVAQGMSAGFRFYSTLPNYVPVPFGENFKINCTTNGTNITTYLFFKKTGPWTALPNPLYPQVTIVKNGDIFTIVDFGIPDSGSYKCHANDSAGKSIEWPRGSTLIPNRNILPKMSIYPHTFLYKLEGQNANFTCQSAIKTDLTWYKMNRQTETQVAADKIVTQIEGYNKKVILMFKNAQLSDSGEYKCILSFKGKTRYELTALKILEIIPVKMISSSPQLTAGVGENVQLECIFEGYPLKPVQWFRNDKQIAVEACSNIIDNNYQLCGEHESSKYKSEFRAIEKYKRYNGTLTIRRTSYPSDQGIYQCRAGEKDQIQKADIFVNIHVKPIINKKESTLMVSSNTPAKISCMVVESNPIPTWTWQFQDRVCIAGSDSCEPSVGNWQPLPKTHTVEPSKSTASNISTISIPKGQKNTFYRCLANNRLGSDNFTKTLLRNDNVEPVKIKDSKVPRVYTAGVEPITLECQVLRQYAPIGVFWFKDNTSISHSQHSLGNVNKSLDDPYISLTLTVENTTTNDTGLYSCKLVLDQSKMDSVQVTVIARVAPNITGLVSQQVKMEDTQYIELSCNTQGANPPSKYTWYFTETKQLQPDIQPLKIGSNLDYKEGCKSRTSGYYYLQSIKNPPLIICKPTHERHTGWYHCKAENIEGSDRKEANVNVLEAARIIEAPANREIKASLGVSLNITCAARGNPVPDVIWTKSGSGEVLVQGKGMARLQFAKLLEKNLGNYTCNATNYKTAVMKFSIANIGSDVGAQSGGKGISQQALVGIICGCLAFVLIVSIICFVVYRRQKKQIEEYKELYFLRTGSSDYKIDPDRSLLDQCNDLPYDLDWEFPEERLILGKPLGAGAFGQVLRAEAIGMAAFNPRDKGAEAVKNRNKLRRSMRESTRKKNEYSSMRVTKTTVAVKTLKEGATQNDYKDLASELKILIHLGSHKNIVNILGACTRGRRLMVIIEYAPHGDLLSFLREKRDIYEPNWIKTSNNPEQEFTLVDLAMAAYQISRGMEFLASRKCVHRDLAARNVLVGKDFVMKISDFGLARDIYKDDLYVKTTSGLLPVKWMAMESLFDRVYTEKSDVWSFGIVLWEIFTLGGNPYPGLPTEQLLDYLSEGQRMKQPQNCPLEMYAIMRDCWMQFPEQRPEFVVIAERLGKILEKNVSEDNPYIHWETDEQTGQTDYYLNPCDTFNTQGRQTADGYEEALPTPRPDTSNKYDGPLPTLPPDSPGYDGPSGPLPSIPPTYEEATMSRRKQSQSSNESGIGIDEKDKDREEKQPLMVHLEDETRFSPGSKGQKRTTESSV